MIIRKFINRMSTNMNIKTLTNFCYRYLSRSLDNVEKHNILNTVWFLGPNKISRITQRFKNIICYHEDLGKRGGYGVVAQERHESHNGVTVTCERHNVNINNLLNLQAKSDAIDHVDPSRLVPGDFDAISKCIEDFCGNFTEDCTKCVPTGEEK